MSNDSYWSCAQTLAWICSRLEPSDYLREHDTHIALVQELSSAEASPLVSVALGELLLALRSENLHCTADAAGKVAQVPNDAWPLMKICTGLDGFYARSEKYTSPCDTKYTRLHFRSSVVRKLWPPVARAVSPKRGRSPKYDWQSFHSEASRVLEDEGDFDLPADPAWKQARLESQMREWCDKNWTQAPAKSTTREHVKIALQSFRKGRAEK